MLSHKLIGAGDEVAHADEGDADTLVIKKALEQSLLHSVPVKVLADATDILVLLIHHAISEAYMMMKNQTISI